MTSKTKSQIKAFFTTGSKPTEAQFIDLIDSYIDKSGPLGTLETAASANGTGVATFNSGTPSISSYSTVRTSMGLTVYTTALAVAAVAGSFLTTAQASALAVNDLIATTAQANAGTATGVLMNPVLVKNAISTLGGSDTFGDFLIHVRDEKSSGSLSGTFTSGAWRTRTLNTIKENNISGASLASSQVTLPVGTYKALAWAPANTVNQHQLRLYNASDAVAIEYGGTVTSSSGSQTAILFIEFTVSGSSKLIELQHQCSSTKSSDGFGTSGSFGNNEIFAELMIWKVS